MLVSSLFFYGWGGPKLLVLLSASILINYLCGLCAAYFRRTEAKRCAVTAAVALNIGLLVFYKYTGFFVGILVSLGADITIPQIVLPIGISFFTFQGLSYVVDVYRNDAKVQRNPLKVALYISFFPQLVAGPVVRYATVADAIDGRTENAEDFSEGATRFLLGLGKKMLLANAMGEIADAVFSRDTAGMPGSLAWVGAIAYTLQIYFDFSAYSDMAIGLGRMFGFRFLENFNYPYIAASVTDFWRRWHISLSTWFKSYVYIPLGGNRCSRLRNILNIFIVWLLTGFWHGAAWTFVIWGIWFGVLLIGEKFIWGRFLAKLPVVGHILTLLAVVVSWVLFRSDSLSYALGYLSAMFGAVGAGWGDAVFYLREYMPEFILCLIAVFPIKTLLQKRIDSTDSKLLRLAGTVGPKLLALLVLFLSYVKLVSGSFNPFIYFQF